SALGSTKTPFVKGIGQKTFGIMTQAHAFPGAWPPIARLPEGAPGLQSRRPDVHNGLARARPRGTTGLRAGGPQMIINRVAPLSAAKIAGVVYAAFGLLVGALFSIIGIAGAFAVPEEGAGVFGALF